MKINIQDLSSTASRNVRKVRASLPIIRVMQDLIPLKTAQRLLKKSMTRVNLDTDVDHQNLTANDVPCVWIIPKNSQMDKVMLYLHGGGFIYGLTPQHVHMGAYLAQKMGIRVLMVDYRTAPKFPFPAALDDCESAYTWLMDQGLSGRDIVVAGDSAGGNLTLTLLLKLRDDNKLLPAAVACLSPVTDLTPEADRRKGFKDPLLSPKSIKLFNQSYLGISDPHNPLISPVLGDFSGIPPMLIHTGEEEILRDDAIRVAALAEAAGVDVHLEIYPSMWHVWQINLSLPQSIQSLNEIALFFRSHLGLDK